MVHQDDGSREGGDKEPTAKLPAQHLFLACGCRPDPTTSKHIPRSESLTQSRNPRPEVCLSNYIVDRAKFLPCSAADFTCAPVVATKDRITPPDPRIEFCNRSLASLCDTRRHFENLDPLRLGPAPKIVDDLRDEPIRYAIKHCRQHSNKTGIDGLPPRSLIVAIP